MTVHQRLRAFAYKPAFEPTLLLYRRIARRRRERLLACEWQGLRFFYPSQSEIGAWVASGHGWDRVLSPILRVLVKTPSPVMADIGTNIGGSLLQMKVACPTARIYCFEPSRRFRRALAKTVQGNGWKDVVIEPLAVSDRDDHGPLFVDDTTASLIGRDYQRRSYWRETVGVTTLDRYFSATTRLDFVKIDTDGFDHRVLTGAADVLARLKPPIFFELATFLFGEEVGAQALRDLQAAGYERFLVFSDVGQALTVTSNVNEIAAIRDPLRPSFYTDVLAVHSDRREQVTSLEILFSSIDARYVRQETIQ